MSKSRRQFLTETSIALIGAAAATYSHGQEPSQQPTPGAPPAFGTAPPVGPEVNADTFAEAGKLVQIEMSEADRAQAAGNWRQAMAPLYERRTGPRKMTLESSVAPATVWNPMLPGMNSSGSSSSYPTS